MTKILTGGVGKTEVADTVARLALDGLEVASPATWTRP